MNLKKFQEQWVQFVTAEALEGDFQKKIIPGGTLTVLEALDVYRIDYNLRLREALSVNYEATWKILGDEDFFQLADKYISQHPSSFDNLTFYGDKFPHFLESFSQEASQMAIFENHFWKLFHSRDTTPIELDPRSLLSITFDLSELALLKSDLNLFNIWQSKTLGQQSIDNVDVFQKRCFAIFKKEHLVEIKILDELEFEILSELKRGVKIPELVCREASPAQWAKMFQIIIYTAAS